MEDAPKKGGAGKFILIGCLLILLLGGGCIGACVLLIPAGINEQVGTLSQTVPPMVASETQRPLIEAKLQELDAVEYGYGEIASFGVMNGLIDIWRADGTIDEEEGTMLLELITEAVSGAGTIDIEKWSEKMGG